MDPHCEVTDHPEQPTLTVKATIGVRELPQFLGKAYEAIVRYLGTLGLYPAGAPFCIYYNMDMNDLQVEAGFPVQAGLQGQEEVQPGTLPAGRWVSCLHRGPYHTLPAAYDAVNAWMAGNNHQPSGAVIEFYLTDPNTTPPDAMQTQIVFPLA